MKIIKIFLLLSFGLWAEFKLEIPNTVDISKLEDIVKNGWNDTNKTLNDLIIKNGKKIFPEVLSLMKNPIEKIESTREAPNPIPKLLLFRDDYMFIFSYLKYLEKKNDIDHVLSIYKTALTGVDNAEEDKTLFSLIARIVFNQITLNALKDSLHSNTLKSIQKNELKVILSRSPMFSEDYFFKYLEYEKEISKKIVRRMLFRSKNQSNIVSKGHMQIYNYFVNYNDLYYKQMVLSLKTKSDQKVERFQEFISSESKNYEYCVEEIEELVEINSDVAFLKNCSAENMGKVLALISIPRGYTFFQDYFQNIEDRKKLIKLLNSKLL